MNGTRSKAVQFLRDLAHKLELREPIAAIVATAEPIDGSTVIDVQLHEISPVGLVLILCDVLDAGKQRCDDLLTCAPEVHIREHAAMVLGDLTAMRHILEHWDELDKPRGTA